MKNNSEELITGSKLRADGIDKPGGIAGWHKPSLVPARPGWDV
jgi:hypothetical protein